MEPLLVVKSECFRVWHRDLASESINNSDPMICRFLQSELMAILEESLTAGERLTADEVLRKARELGLHTRSESVAMIRADRDAR